MISNISLEQTQRENIEFADIVFCQAILESGHFKSKVVTNNNNLFGMRHPSRRKTLSKGSRFKYAIFDNWYDSVKDYKLWQDNFLKNKCLTRKQYLNYIEKKYCGYPNYIKNLNLIHKKYQYMFK
jgi:flagellum-specific peptidoglycan hydrolase FlgJ